jgi:hypothetical protein
MIKGIKQNKKLWAGVICVAIFGILLLSPGGYFILKDDLNYNPVSQSSVTYGVYKYEDGEFLPIPVEKILQSIFDIGGEPVSQLAPKVEWVSTGEGIDWSTFSLTGDLDVRVLIETWQDRPQHPDGGFWSPSWMDTNFAGDFSSISANSSWSNIFVLGTDLCLEAHTLDSKVAHPGEIGWGYAFSGEVTGSVYDEFGGGPLTDTAYFGGLSVWITYTANYEITVTII